MGNVRSLFRDDSKQLFDKSAYLQYPSRNSHNDGGYSSKFAYYQAMREAAARMELTKIKRSLSTTSHLASATRELDGGDAANGDAAQATFMLAHWPRDMDIVFDRNDEFPVSISVEQELDFDPAAEAVPGSSSPPAPLAAARSSRSRSIVATQEESILKGLSESKLSSSEAIHKAVEQLRLKYNDDPDRFLCVLAKYPRATRLFSSQQLHARHSVDQVFRLCILSQNYAQAAHITGKLAYGEHTSRVKKKLMRLDVMSKLLRHAVEDTSASSSTRSSASEKAGRVQCSSRSANSFSLAMTDEAIALLRRQSDMQSELGVECLVGSSLVETLHKLFALCATHLSALSLAIDVAEHFEVHPRQFSWALLKVFAQTEQWQTLLVVTTVARPAIGYLPVIEQLLDEDHADLAHDLLALIDAPHEREEIMAALAKHHAHRGSEKHVERASNTFGEVGGSDDEAKFIV